MHGLCNMRWSLGAGRERDEKGESVMREITVKYILSDEEENRLRKITEAYRKQGLNKSEDKMFESIMTTGSESDIGRKFEYHEQQLDTA